MFAQCIGQVQVNQSIATNHEKRIIEKPAEVLDSPNATGGSDRLGNRFSIMQMALKGITDLDTPAASIPEITFYGLGEVTDVHHDLVKAVTAQLLDQVFHDGLTQNRNHGLGHFMGQWTHPGALPSRQYHRLHRLGTRSEQNTADSTGAGRCIQDRAGGNDKTRSSAGPS